MSGIGPDLRNAVLTLLAATKYAKDDEDERRFAACWSRVARLAITSNGKALPVVEGREAIIAFYRRVWADGGHGRDDTREVHVAEHPDIVLLDDGRLRARHATCFFHAQAGKPRLRGFGTFDDELVHESGAWRIIHRRAVITRGS